MFAARDVLGMHFSSDSSARRHFIQADFFSAAPPTV